MQTPSGWRVGNELFQKFSWLSEKLNDMSFINGLHVLQGSASFTEWLFLQSRAATKSYGEQFPPRCDHVVVLNQEFLNQVKDENFQVRNFENLYTLE